MELRGAGNLREHHPGHHADGDALSFTASAGAVATGAWSGSFATAGIKTVTITAGDGVLGEYAVAAPLAGEGE